MPKLDVDFVRSQFPTFMQPELKGWAFFENAGGSYPCKQVVNKLTEFYTRTKVQPYYPYPAALTGGAAMDAAYVQLAAYLNVDPQELHLGPSTSQNTYVLAQAFKPMLQPGDEIIVTNQDHEANSGAWRRLAEIGVTIREWQIDSETGLLSIEALDALLSERTRLIAFPHCSNVVAHMNPVKEIVARARQQGAVTIVDGVAAAPHGFPDIKDLGADVYLFSLYKTWGPHLGLMTVKQELLSRLGNQGHFFHEGLSRKMLLPAGPDHAQIAAAAGIASYFDSLVKHHFKTPPASAGKQLSALFHAHELELLTPLMAWLKQRRDIRIIGPADAADRAPTVSIQPLRKALPDVYRTLTEHKLMVGSGHFYAARLLEAMGIPLDPGVLRISFLHYTRLDEIQQLIRGLEEALDS